MNSYSISSADCRINTSVSPPQSPSAVCSNSPLQHALASAHRACDPGIAAWEEDIGRLLKTTAHSVKFTVNREDVSRAVDRLISIGLLVVAVQTKRSPENYIDVLREKGITGLAHIANSFIGLAASLPVPAADFGSPPDANRNRRALITRCMAAKDAYAATAIILETITRSAPQNSGIKPGGDGRNSELGWTPFSNQQELKISYGMRV